MIAPSSAQVIHLHPILFPNRSIVRKMIKTTYWDALWPYLLGLSKAPTTLGYVGSHLHGQKQISRDNPHQKAVKTCAWQPPPQVNGSEPQPSLYHLFNVIVFVSLDVIHFIVYVFKNFLTYAFEHTCRFHGLSKLAIPQWLL